MSKSRLLLLGVLAVLVLAAWLFDVGQYLNLDYLKQQQTEFAGLYAEQPWTIAGWFFLVYVLSTAISLPGASVLTLLAGAIFGLGWGVLLVSFASTLGATLAFWVSRYLLRGWVKSRFSDRYQQVSRGVERDGAFYLFTLRLIVVFPYWMVNLLSGLTTLKTRTYFWVSQLGMFPATVVFVNAGTQLAQIERVSDVLSPVIIGSLALLGLFPWIARFIVRQLQRYKVLKSYDKPETFDYNLVVIGAGSGGLVSAYIGQAVKAKVALIEKGAMGGDCLNTGCVPSKALIRSARFLAELARAKHFGIRSAEADFDFAEVMERVQSVVKRVEPHDSVERYSELGVTCLSGEACITSPWTVEVNGQQLSSRRIVVATGAGPFVPPIEGLVDIPFYTSETIWGLRKRPERLLVLGGGPIGVELAQSFQRLGSSVILVEQLPRLLLHEDEVVSTLVHEQLTLEGLTVLPGHRAVRFYSENELAVVELEHSDGRVQVEFDALLVAVGRRAYTDQLGLQALGVELNPDGTIPVDAYLQTRVPTIYACGDVVGPYQLTHAAAHQAWYAAVNGLFGDVWRFKVDYRVMPRVTFCDPEVATVGLTEHSAQEAGVTYELTEYDLAELDRAIADGDNQGRVRVLTVPGRDKILGATLVGAHAGELISEFVLAMRHGLGLKKLLATIHAYPTWVEANKYAAGAWQQRHQPTLLLSWVERYHRWKRES